MSLKTLELLAASVILASYIMKSYILKIGLTEKDKILLKYTPPTLFLLVNVAFLISLLDTIYVIVMNPSAEHQDWSDFFAISSLFFWLAMGVFGRWRYLKATHQAIKEIYFHIAVLVSYVSFFAILYFM